MVDKAARQKARQAMIEATAAKLIKKEVERLEAKYTEKLAVLTKQVESFKGHDHNKTVEEGNSTDAARDDIASETTEIMAKL